MKQDPIQGSVIFLHGFNKVGKTNLAYGFPKPILIATEGGHKYAPANVKIVNLDPDNGWESFKRLVTQLKTKKFKTVVVDTIDNLYRWAMAAIMTKRGNADHPGDADDYGASWDAVRFGFNHQLHRLVSLCEKKKATLLMISHSAYREVTTLTEKFDKVMTSLPGQAQDIILAGPDDIWHLAFGVDANDRVLHLRGANDIQCGSRCPTLVVEKVSLPRDPKSAYLKVCKAYQKRKKKKQ